MSKKAKPRPRAIATIEDAKKVWELIDRPTHRKVAKVLCASGKYVSESSIYRWHSAGWKHAEKDMPAPGEPPEAAKLEAVLTGENLDKLKELFPEAPVDTLESKSDLEVLRTINRRGAIVAASLLEELDRQKHRLLLLAPKEASALVNAIFAAMTNVNKSYDVFTMVRDRLIKDLEPINHVSAKPSRIIEMVEHFSRPVGHG